MTHQPAPGNDVGLLAASEAARALLRLTADALLDPHVLLEAAKDSSGRIVDFVYRELNRATSDYLGLPRAELIGRGVAETMPGIREALLPGCIRCLETGEPLIIDDLPYANENLRHARRYDLRATRATPTSIVVHWRDVTDRFQVAQRAAAAEVKFRRSMDNAAIGMCLIAPDGRFEEANAALCEFFGYDAETLKHKTWQELTAPEYLEVDLRNVEDVLDGRIDSYRMLKQYINADGHPIWGDLAVSCVRDEHGAVVNFISQITDITVQVGAEERNRLLAQQLEQQNARIAASESNYRLLADNAVDVVIRFRGHEVVWASPSIEAALGGTAQRFLGLDFDSHIHPDDLDTLSTSLRKIAPGESLSQRFRVRAADGEHHWVDGHGKPYIDAEGNADGLILALRMVDDQVDAEQQLKASRERFEAVVANSPSAISVRDLGNRYTLVNDAFCQLFGKKSVGDVVGRLEDETVTPDVLERSRRAGVRLLAGEDFVEEEESISRGRETLSVMTQRFVLRNSAGAITELATIRTDITHRKEIELAAAERARWEARIWAAIANGTLLVYSQPIVDIATRETVAEELLVRLGSVDSEAILAPAGFLPQCEQYGLMPVIDRYMIGRAIHLARSGREVSVNITGQTIGDPASMSEILQALVTAGPGVTDKIIFEITETMALASPGVAKTFSRGMRDLGCRVALDDFGTGYGAFTELRNLDLDALKIDLGFVQNMLEDPDDERVVKTIVFVARAYGLTTVAEGVETEALLEKLAEFGVDRAQGYLFGKPKPIDW